MLEFTLAVIPLIFVIVSVVELGVAMWNYHTLAEGVKLTTRWASVHGADCAGQTCGTTVGQVTTHLTNYTPGLDKSKLNLTLTSAAGSVSCTPVSSCTASGTAWPSVSQATRNNTDISISANYPFAVPVPVFVIKGGGTKFGSFTFYAQSREMVLY
jgi:Flp pilus assembly protein TadG